MVAKSPFPGMDPYLEAHWRDVHSRLVVYVSDALQPWLPIDLKARVEERVFVEGPEGVMRGVYPDVRVVEREIRPPTTAAAPAAVIDVAEAIVVNLESEPVTETFIEIVEVGTGRRVVTVIEVLSPSNKAPGEGQDLYRKKQSEVVASGTNLVEIDLLRGGERTLSVPWHRIPLSHRTHSVVCMRKAVRPTAGWVYRAPLRDRLPIVAVPLRPGDPEIPLDLQAAVDRVYELGRYDDLDYRREPDPPLEAADAVWADALLRSAGRR